MRRLNIAQPLVSPAWTCLLLSFPIAALALAVYLPLLFLGERAATPLDPVPLILAIGNDPLYRTALITTFAISAYVTLGCLLVGSLMSIFMVHIGRRAELFVLALVVSSWWMSVLLRSFVWIVLLQENGPISTALRAVGLNAPVSSILFTKTAVVLAMIHVLSPIAVLIFWASLRERARELRNIAHSLGSSDTFYFFRVLVPYLRTGAFAAGSLVFLLATGFYVTPELLGGGNGSTLTIGVLIEEQIDRFGDWQKASAIALLLVFAIAIAFVALVATRRLRLSLMSDAR